MHYTSEIDRYLSEVPLFSGCSKRELQTVSALTNAVTVPAGKVVTSEGRTGRQFVLILEGNATVSIGGTEIAGLGQGDFFGEIGLLDVGPRTATVTADTDLTAIIIYDVEFFQLLKDVPTMARNLLVDMAARLRDTDLRLAQ